MAKQINWQQAPDHLDADLCDDFGLYIILDSVLFIGHDGYGTPYDSEEAAKAAAQADWDARVAGLKGGAA